MRGVYRQPFRTAALTAGPAYLLVLTAPATAVVEILEATVGTTNNATSQQLEFFLQRASTAGSGGTALTPSKVENGDQAAGSTLSMTPTGAPTLTTNTEMGQ